MVLDVLILAAGKGTRMRSRLPKVLHDLGGKPLLQHVHDAANELNPRQLAIVYGHGGELLPETLNFTNAGWVLQADQQGTGHAVQLGLEALPAEPHDGVVLILYGDVPLITAATLEPLVASAATGAAAILTVDLPNPTGYGRIVRDAGGNVQRIVEESDASPAHRAISEINTGIMAMPSAMLRRLTARLGNDNAQGEYYLTDVIGFAVAEQITVKAIVTGDAVEVSGINSRSQLAELERVYQSKVAESLMQAGCTLADPSRIDVRGELRVAEDVFIDVGCVFEGKVTLGSGTRIGPNCMLRNIECGEDVEIFANCVLEDSSLGDGVNMGPFARLRPGARLEARAKLGNFVEVKNSTLGEGTKANHLAYIGDTTIGRKSNVGAGAIVCNYDGANKHRTNIGDDVFVGSNTALIAPVTIGSGATIGAGSTISNDVPDDTLAVARAKVRHIDGWQRPTKKK